MNWRGLSPQARWRRYGPPGVLLIALAIAIFTYADETFRSLELDSTDARFRYRGEQEPPRDVFVVAIDSDSLTELGRFPFPRRFHAQVIDRLREDGASQISYDVQFTERTNYRNDLALFEAIDRTPHVVLAATETTDRGRTNVLGGDSNLRQIGARAGFSAFRLDERSIPRFIPRVDQNLDTFAVATVEADERRQVDPADEPDRNPWINYHGPAKTFPTIPFVDVMKGRTAPGLFEDAIVIVGATANNLQDVHDTPFRGVQTPGPEIQANAVATVLEGWPLRSSARWLDIVLIAGLALAATLLARRLTPLIAFGTTVLLGGAYLAAAQIAFNAGSILPVVYPMLALGATGVGNLGLAYITTAFDRQRTKDTFARFVPESVVGEVLARADGVRLGGEQAEATILFSDIRGFTTFSETRTPEEVIAILNRYLTAMTDAILDQGGTLVSYMGDGIMAVFGAPIPQPDHADRALRAARQMLGPKLSEFNAYATGELGIEGGFQMGVGLNTGTVMSGMVGSERRLDYTTIGDAVNTASRLEGATKQIDGSLLVADSTRDALGEAAEDLIYVDEIEIRGRAKGLRVWTIPGI